MASGEPAGGHTGSRGGPVPREVWETRSLWDGPLGSWFSVNDCLGSSALLAGRAKWYWHREFISFSLLIVFNKTVSLQSPFYCDNQIYVNADLRQVLKFLEGRLFIIRDLNCDTLGRAGGQTAASGVPRFST